MIQLLFRVMMTYFIEQGEMLFCSSLALGMYEGPSYGRICGFSACGRERKHIRLVKNVEYVVTA